jgi:hypothetical protein
MPVSETDLMHVAQVAYNAMLELQILHGVFKDEDVRFWDEMDEDERKAVCDAVRYTINNRIEGAQLRHIKWVKRQLKAGWTRGTVFNEEKKWDPNVCEWEKLPVIERHRQRLFVAVINSLA